jgi:multicomponent Na+:H+ antiporter subunit A
VLAFAATAAILPFVARWVGTRAFYLAALPPLAAVVWALAHLSDLEHGGAVEEHVDWVPELGLRLGLRFDGFAALMVGLVAGIGVLVFVYARGYFGRDARVGRFAATLLSFSGAMLGLVLSDNLLAVFLFWELTSITSYLLIGTEDEKVAARSGAQQALLITGGGGLAMLGGFVLLGEAAGTYSMSALVADPPSGTVVSWALVLVLLGVLTKSAQVPFHSWLPRAMNAPTPVSAYLHSATMVKAGVYLVARLSPGFATAAPWRPIVLSAGLASLLVGGYRALRQHDLKLVLAYGTISQLGFMMVLFGVGTPEATYAGCALLVAHGVFKAALFMLVGVIDHQTHTRDLRVLGGLGRRWPLVAATGAVVAASMAGVPPLLGFVAKEEALASLGETGAAWGPWVLAGVVVGAVLTAGYSARFVWGAFGPATSDGRRELDLVAEPAHPGAVFIAPAVLLAGVTLLVGLVPAIADSTVGRGFQALWGEEAHHHLALWHGFTPALGMSAIALLGGGLMFAWRDRVGRLQDRLPVGPSAQGGYERSLRGVLKGADIVTGTVQNGSLPFYLGVIVLTIVGVAGAPLLSGSELPDLWFTDTPAQVAVGAVMIACALAAAVVRRRFAAVILVGAVGYGMAALFLVQGAPDLAITQLLIETLSVVIFVLVFRHLPDKFPRSRIRGSQAPRILIAVAAAAFMFVFTLATVGARSEAPISDEYLTRAYPEGGGNNVVNVIIVDFRGFDTMGEITVLAVAVLGVAAIVQTRRAARRGAEVPDRTGPGSDDPQDAARAERDLTLAAEGPVDPDGRSSG